MKVKTDIKSNGNVPPGTHVAEIKDSRIEDGHLILDLTVIDVPRRFCKARGCIEENPEAVLLGPNDEPVEFCLGHYRHIIRNTVDVPWVPLEEAMSEHSTAG